MEVLGTHWSARRGPSLRAPSLGDPSSAAPPAQARHAADTFGRWQGGANRTDRRPAAEAQPGRASRRGTQAPLNPHPPVRKRNRHA